MIDLILNEFAIDIEPIRQLDLKLLVVGPEPRCWVTYRVNSTKLQEQEADGPMTNPGTPVVMHSFFEVHTPQFAKPKVEGYRVQHCAIVDNVAGV